MTTKVVDEKDMDVAAVKHFQEVASGYETLNKAIHVLVDSKLPAPGGEYWCQCYQNSFMVVVMFCDGLTNRDRTVGNFVIEE